VCGIGVCGYSTSSIDAEVRDMMGNSPNLERRYLGEHGVTYGATKGEHTFLFICMERLGICHYCTTKTKLGLPK
jgi:hypothetical protein